MKPLVIMLLFLVLVPAMALPYASGKFEDYNFTTTQMLMNDSCPTPPKTTQYIHNWSCGEWKIDHGEMRRVFTLEVSEKSWLNIGHGESFAGWTFNHTIPGPTLRMTEGDPVTVYIKNLDGNKLPHNFHMHSIHRSGFDAAGIIPREHDIDPGTRGQYLFTASPAGVYPYHCHVVPVSKHISQGLFGMMIIDPQKQREPANESFIIMSGYDQNLDGVNDWYVYNGLIHNFADRPIVGKVGELQRIYLVNMLEYRDTMSFHLHGQMFNYWASGTTNSSMIYTDIVTLSQGDRGILEFTNNFYCCEGSSENRNTFMFHPHANDAAEKGMMGFMDFPQVKE